MKKTNSLFIIISCALLLTSCHKSSRFEIDTTKNRVDVQIQRFDKDLLSIDTANMKSGVNNLYARYPEFMQTFTDNILDTASTDTTAVRNLIQQYLSDSTFAGMNKKTLETFKDISDIETKVSDAYTYIHHYFPGVTLPQVYMYVSGLNRPVMMNEKFIGMGGDFYLGKDFPLYKNMSYDYLIYNMRRECLAADIVSTTLFRMFVMDGADYRLLDNMLFRGKVMYLLSVVMPNEKPEILMGYSPEQWEWSKKYEKEIWASIIDKKHLFTTDLILIRKYMNEAPFTAPVSQQSPGRLGTYIGWQIVKSYMDKNTKVSLTDLMNNSNYQKMLEDSGYRP